MVVGAELQAAHALRLLAARGQHDDRRRVAALAQREALKDQDDQLRREADAALTFIANYLQERTRYEETFAPYLKAADKKG